MKQKIAPAVLILGGTFILQYHSIRFWSGYVDPNIGFVWSLVIEGSGLWLWYRQGWASRSLAILASVLLLAGPVYHLSLPALQKQGMAEASQVAHQVKVDGLKNQIEEHAQLLETFAQNSTERTGWLESIERTEQALSKERSELARLLENPPETLKTNTLSLLGLVLLQVLGLVLIQVSNIVVINHLSTLRSGAQEAVRNDLPEEDGIVQDSLLAIKEAVGDLIEQEGLSLSAAADRFEVDRHNLGHLLRYQGGGDRKPAQAVVDRLSQFIQMPQIPISGDI
ncbi:MAG: hypothetical protein RQ867_06690 [Mariprofundaceae bacterium]|nr:hypothetical protein [Mariprofundaceae bacterium]